jgi:hypothetical protein
MNPIIRIFLFCPVPKNQKPLTELVLFQENNLFQWITFSKNKFKKFFFFFSLFIFLFSLFVIYPFFSFKISFSFLINSFLFFNSFLLFFFFLAFFRWSELEKRLSSSRLVYEEGSWYDVQVWEKPLNLIKNERLISSQKIQPVLQRISFILFVLLLWDFCFFTFYLL